MRSKGVRRSIMKAGMLDVGNIFGAEQSDSLTFKLPPSKVALNRHLLKEVQQMKEVAARHHMLYLTANQVESLNRLFVVNRLHSLTALTHPKYCDPADYQAYINPTIVGTKGESIEVQEQCLAIPFITFLVPRFSEIDLQFRDEKRDYRIERLTGGLAHMAQHCINHLDGHLLLDYELSHGRFYVQKDIANNFPKTNFLLKEYSLRLKNHHSNVAKGQAKIDDQKFVDMKKDYIERLKEEYDKQNRAFSLKIEKKNPKNL